MSRHRHAEVALVAEGQPLGLDLALRVAVHLLVGQRLGLVGAVVVSGRVDTEGAQVDKALQRLPFASVQQVAEPGHVDGAEFLDRTPLADLGGSVDDHVRSQDGPLDHGGGGEVAPNELHAEVLQELGVALGPGDSADRQSAAFARLGHVTAHEAGGTGDEVTRRHIGIVFVVGRRDDKRGAPV